MEKAYRILAINPGSTYTKIAIFTNEEMTFSRELKHSAEDLKDFHHINDQLDLSLIHISHSPHCLHQWLMVIWFMA